MAARMKRLQDPNKERWRRINWSSAPWVELQAKWEALGIDARALKMALESIGAAREAPEAELRRRFESRDAVKQARRIKRARRQGAKFLAFLQSFSYRTHDERSDKYREVYVFRQHAETLKITIDNYLKQLSDAQSAQKSLPKGRPADRWIHPHIIRLASFLHAAGHNMRASRKVISEVLTLAGHGHIIGDDMLDRIIRRAKREGQLKISANRWLLKH
jgi:hypothetical protein